MFLVANNDYKCLKNFLVIDIDKRNLFRSFVTVINEGNL